MRKYLLGAALLGVLFLAACSNDDETSGDATLSPGQAMGPGISVSDAKKRDLSAPLLVNGYVVAVGEETRLCEVLLESFPPQCGGESLFIEGLDLEGVTDLQSEGSVRWTDTQVQLLGEIEGVKLVVSTTSSG